MQNQINTTAISQFAQMLRASELSQQKELKIPIQQARLLNATLLELLDKVNQDYETLFKSLQNNTNPNSKNDEVVTIQLDGGYFGD
jgi:uncharacterized protein YdiU (UPF0061 family)